MRVRSFFETRQLTPLWMGVAVFLASLAVFSVAAFKQPAGYEAETWAVTAGLVAQGEPRIIELSPPTSRPDRTGGASTSDPRGQLGRAGGRYGRSTITQNILQAPFYAAGLELDNLTSNGRSARWRDLSLTFYNPFIAALAAAAVFGIVLLRFGSARWACAIAGAFTFGSLAWPYSSIGMETTLMSLTALVLFLVLVSLRVDLLPVWAATGFVAGATATTKPYGIVVVAPLFIPVLARLRDWPRRRWVYVAAAVAVPMLAWGCLQLWYNAYRFGGIFTFGTTQRFSPTLAAPFNLLGFIASPGKGLLFYSPLVLLGVLGLPQLWRRDRLFALTVIAGFGFLTLLMSGSAHWSDETWGPRYIVPVAWLFLLPIPWWYARARRPRLLAAVATLAVLVQLTAIAAPYSSFVAQYRGLTGALPTSGGPRLGADFDRRAAPFGRDPYRWVPQLSPLVIRAETVASALVFQVTGDPITVTYAPFFGPERSSIPDLTLVDAASQRWWGTGGLGGPILAVALTAAGAMLWFWLAVSARRDPGGPLADGGWRASERVA